MTKDQGSVSGSGAPSTHVVGISLEDYYQVGAFRTLVDREHWGRFESRLARSTGAALDLLDEVGARATFFTLGWVAEHMPELVRDVVARGHEVANAGFSHHGIRGLDADGLRADLARGHAAIASATGMEPLGVRIPDFVRPRDRWALDVVAGAGYAYDASLRPMGRDTLTMPLARTPFVLGEGARALRVFPVPTLAVGPWLLPVGGGAWLRQLPGPVMRHALRRWESGTSAPFSLYFQVWELDREQPRITAASRWSRLRHYRHLDRAADRLREVMSGRRFTSYAQHLQLAARPVTTTATQRAWVRPVLARRPATSRATVVVPCYNEAESLPYLLNTLASVQGTLAGRWQLSFVFVNDGSRDDTGRVLQELVGHRADCQVITHPANRGIAHAIRTGIAAARDEYVCSIDADCTYDPHQLEALLPALEQGAILATASPYHPEGRVRHVPSWRLVLSRTLSRMYAHVLGTDLHTYTSCFRAYRRSAMLDLPQEHGGFLGIAEMLARVVRAGGRVAEVPATLEVRLIGHSKLKVLRVIAGHLGLLASIRQWPREARHDASPVSTPAAT